MEYKLYYFNVRNLAEPIRVILHYNSAPFEDVRFDFEEWAKVKATMPQRTLPVLEVQGKKLSQSHAIMRYLGRVFNMTGRNNIERAIVDSVADLLRDLYNQVGPWYYIVLGVRQGDVEAKKDECLLPAVETKFPIFVQYLKDAKSGFYARSGLTYVDFMCSEMFDTLNGMEPSIFNGFGEILEHVKRVHALPQLQDYLARRS